MGSSACCQCGESASPDQVSTSESMTGINSDSPKKHKKGAFTAEELNEYFENADRDGSGTLNQAELAGLLEDMQVKFTVNKLQVLFRELEPNEEGLVSREAFAHFFAGKEKKLGMGKILQTVINEKAQARADNKKDKDVYILHDMEEEAGLKRSWWVSDVLEFADLHCTGPYISTPLEELALHSRKSIATSSVQCLKIEECECACLVIDGKRPPSKKTLEELKTAVANKMNIVCLYEAEPDSWQNLSTWRSTCPEAFKTPAVAVSMHFLSDSEQLVLTAVYRMLGQEAPLLTTVRPPGGDLDDFQDLNRSSVRWLKAEYTLALRPTMIAEDMPDDAFEKVTTLRPCFISYAQDDPVSKGLNNIQRQRLKEAVKRNSLEGKSVVRVYFLDQVSSESMTNLSDTDMSEVLSLSRFIILDELESTAADPRPYLARGRCFLEAMIAMLTGALATCRDGQFQELDTAIGGEIQEGVNLRRYVREHKSNAPELIEALCGALRRKKFVNEEEEQHAEEILRRTLERHPLLVPGPQHDSK